MPSSKRCLWAAALALCAAVFASPAGAHAKSTTYSSWQIEGSNVRGAFTVPMLESARLAQPGEEQPANDVVVAYLDKKLSVTADEQPCKPAAAPHALSASSQFRRFEFA